MVTKKIHPPVNNLFENSSSQTVMAHEKLWADAQNLLRDLLNPDIFNLWFAPLKAAALTDDSITLEVANDFSELWIKDNYGGVIKDAVTSAAGRPLTVLVAAAPPSPTLLARMEALDMRVVHVYGLTETYGPHTVCTRQDDWGELPIEERARLLARQGQGYIIADLVRVVDDEMNDVPRDAATLGEVVMRGNNVMAGYFRNEEATAQAFRGGWFHSGDLAVWHPDDAIELRDRAKDVIISGGENISSIEVEQALCAHPAVLECAVIAVPDDHWGERPKAFVTLKPGASAGEQELIAFTRSRLAHFKCPDTIAFGPLPKTSTGKVQKGRLREPEWASRERRIN